MGDVLARYRAWFVVGAALGATLIPFDNGHYAWPRATTFLVVWAAIVSHRGRAVVAVMPTVVIAGWSLLTTGDFVPLCCSYASTPWEMVVVVGAVGATAWAVQPPRNRRGVGTSDTLATALALALLSQGGLVMADGRLDTASIGLGVAAVFLGLGLGSGLRPWALAVLPLAVTVGVLNGATHADLLVLIVALAASTTGPIERLLERFQVSASTTS